MVMVGLAVQVGQVAVVLVLALMLVVQHHHQVKVSLAALELMPPMRLEEEEVV